MRSLKLFLPAVLICLLLTGCTGKEPNEIAYVVAIGIDSGENGDYKITIQYANPNKISGGEEGGKIDESGVENLAFDAPNIYAAVGLADRADSKTFSLSHTKLIVFSEEIARKGIADMAEVFIRNEELRPDVYLAISPSGAGNYLENINPATEINPTKYYHFMFDKNKLMGLPEGTQNNFHSSIETGEFDLLLPMAMIENEEVAGSAVFRGDRMVGILDEDETEIYKLLDEDNASGYLTMKNDTTFRESVTVKTSQRRKPKYIIDDQNRQITVRLFLEGDMSSLPTNYNIEQNQDIFEMNSGEYVSEKAEKLMKTVMQNYGSDIFRLKERSKIKFLTNSEYEDYKKHTDYRDYDVKVETDFNIRTTGLVIREE